MEALLQNKIRKQLNEILPGLSRFAMVLTGDEDSGDGLLAVFCARVMFADILDTDGADFTKQSFKELYKCWLEQIEVGVVSTHIEEQNSQVYQPGEFATEGNSLVLETGAFLVSLLPTHRAALLLVYGEGYTYFEAADILTISVDELTYCVSTACTKLAGQNTYHEVRNAQTEQINSTPQATYTAEEKSVPKAKSVSKTRPFLPKEEKIVPAPPQKLVRPKFMDFESDLPEPIFEPKIAVEETALKPERADALPVKKQNVVKKHSADEPKAKTKTVSQPLDMDQEGTFISKIKVG